MNLHESITLVALVGPLTYALGRFDEKRCADDGTLALGFVVLILASISAAVAITLRIVG
jgi:hypothetical protein